jgi:hypothetical protein
MSPIIGLGAFAASELDKVFSVIIIIMTETDIETSVYYVHLTRLIAREDFIKVACCY